MFYLWSVLSRELSACMFLNKASEGAGLLFVCSGWVLFVCVCGAMLEPTGSSMGPAGALEVGMGGLSGLERSTDVQSLCVAPCEPRPLLHLSSSPAAVLSQAINLSAESRITNSSHNPFELKHGSNLMS